MQPNRAIGFSRLLKGRRNRLLHLIVWLVAGAILFWVWGGLIPRIRWNAIELMMGRNLLLGNGLTLAPLDPPALYRPVLGALLCASVELFTTDPFAVCRIVYAVSLTVFLIASFYAARALWDRTAGHAACLFILTSGALTARLVTHFQSLSHIAFLLTVGPALWATVLALQRRTRIRLLVAGVCWGFTYLARWETLSFFAVTLAVLAYATYAEKKDVRASVRCSFAVLGFAALLVPTAIYQSWAKARYEIWGPSAITTFYAAEAWVTGNGDEDAGFAEAVRKYGSLEANHFSMFRAMAHNPGALGARLRINIPKFLALFMDKEFFDPLWLVLLAGFAFDVGWTRKHLPALTWLFLLFLCSTTVCFFEIDSRYLTIAIPSILLLLCGGVTCFGNWVNRVWGRGKPAAVVACLVLLGLRPAITSYHQLIAAKADPWRREGVRTVKFAHGIGEHFRRVARPARPVTLMINLKTIDVFLVSYFAETGICWRQPREYPRDKIFSWTAKDPDYLYLPEASLYETDILLKGRPIGRYEAPGGDVYYLFQTPWRPFDPSDDSRRDLLKTGFRTPRAPFGDGDAVACERLRETLARDYPSLVPRFQEESAAAGLTAMLAVERNTWHADKVGCGVLASRPDGHEDRVFRLILTPKPGYLPLMQGAEISYVELQREAPWGIFHTSNQNYVLGVAQDGSGLLNGADGGVSIVVKERNALSLFACDDGGNLPGTAYWCRLRIGNNGWISSERIRLP